MLDKSLICSIKIKINYRIIWTSTNIKTMKLLTH